MSDISRRSLFGGALATGAVALGVGSISAAAATPPPRPAGQTSMIDVAFAARPTVRVGVIGVGNRGSGMIGEWARVPGCVVTAVCDIRRGRAQAAADNLVAGGRPRPAVYGGTDVSYQALLAQNDIDLVYIATPWEFHYVQGRDAMEAGKHVCVELPIATTTAELWSLVDTSERTRRHLMLAENCSYGRNELAMLRMAQAGVFGEITNGHGGYLHDLRALLFNDGYYTDSWRRLWHTRSTASFYHMHGLAPVAAAMDINRGDRFATVSAAATPARGLADYRARFVPAGHPSWNETYVNGDLVTCHIKTAKGYDIRTAHDVSTPRPYSRINSVAGTRGLFEDYAGTASGARVYFEPAHTNHAWSDFGTYGAQYEHWLWTKLGGTGGGHGGMDYILTWRTVQLMRAGLVPDIDVYDSAAWCAPIPLSVDSLALNGAAVELPDFTRGDWSRDRPGGLNSPASDMPTGGATTAPFATFAAAFDNVGITSRLDTKPGDFDGSGNSFSAENLAAAGVNAGATVTALGASITWPSGIGKNNNVTGRGQVIKLSGRGSKLVVLGSGVGSAPSGAVVVKYTDGTTASGTVTFPNWTVAPSGGATAFVTVAGRNTQSGPGNADFNYTVFAHSVALDPAKTTETVTLPSNYNMHFFGIGLA